MPIALGFLHPKAYDLVDGKGICQGPESGHNHQAEKDVAAFKEGWAQPDEMANEDAGSRPVEIMDGPPRVHRIFKQLRHTAYPN
jgi:hypothetical protein